MLTAHAEVPTERAGRYLAQLCRHFAHKVRAEWDDEHGRTDFGWGTCEMTATPDALHLRVHAPDEESLARVEHVVADHATRFGARDHLTVTWQRHEPPAGDPTH